MAAAYLLVAGGGLAAAGSGSCATVAQTAGERIQRNDVLPDGAIAITYGRTRVINPYFSNLIALGIVRLPGGPTTAERWIRWYLGHLNWPDADGVYGTIDDYAVDPDGGESSRHRADSTDAYAATLLTLARALFEAGDPAQRAYIRSIKYQLDAIGGVIVEEQQPDGLTWAKPRYRVAYLLDNCEVYQGLGDLAFLMNAAFRDRHATQYYSSSAAAVAHGINLLLWDALRDRYLIAVGAFGSKDAPRPGRWYPGAYGQIFPIVTGLLSPSSQRAIRLYHRLNRTFPDWSSRTDGTLSPSGAVGYAAALLGDRRRAEALIAMLGSPTSTARFARDGGAAEQAWLIRTCTELNANGGSRRSPAPDSESSREGAAK
ncbi:MAG: hypothetical protein ACREM8_02310 [Vulcanimicrobiaceae bacterium]